MMRTMKINKIILHCSDSPDNVDIGVAEIREWHINERGWRDIGYHYVIRRNGTVEVGRYENGDSVLEDKEIGAHTFGENSDSLGICWVGKNNQTREQRQSLIKLCAHLVLREGLSHTSVYGHREFDKNKTCPNIDMDEFRKGLLHYLKTLRG